MVIDTNVLLYAAERRSPEHDRCMAALEAVRGGGVPWYLTWGIAYEFVRVFSHPGGTVRLGVASDAWQFIRDLLSSPGASMLSETPRHADVAQEVFRSHPEVKGSVVFDAHTAILMKEHGVRRILTRDADFFRFPFLEVIDPLADEPSAVREARARYRHRPARRLSAAGKR